MPTSKTWGRLWVSVMLVSYFFFFLCITVAQSTLVHRRTVGDFYLAGAVKVFVPLKSHLFFFFFPLYHQ